AAAPRHLAEQIGWDWDGLTDARVRGIGQGSVGARLGRLPIRLGHVDLTVRCLFLDAPSVPFLLGCADLLDRFVLTIDQRRGRIILDEIP
ncbi:MAG: hypothetical protein ACRDI2_11815, partial [Chloroflexota bacterium]